MKVKVNEDACIGCGACTAVCPNVFTFSDDGSHAVAKVEEVNEADKEAVNEAKDGCPTLAISVE